MDQDRLAQNWLQSDAEPFDSPSVKEFPKALAKNLRGLFTKRNLMPLIVGASITAGASTLDSTLRKSPENGHHFAAFGGLGHKLGNPAYLAAIFSSTFVAGRLSHDSRFRAMSYDLMQGYVITTALTAGLKHAIGRERPNHEDSLSFPSGHASTAFTYATVLSHYYGLDAAIPAYAMAGFIGFSRVEKNAHNLSDVVAGMALGYIVGRTVVHRDEAKGEEEPRFTWMPQVVPGGAGVHFTINF
ncbi:MAG TPA: phosphatase PAP2 family protein [Acidobacteriota bacterium]